MLATVSSADAWALSLSLSSFFFPAGAALDAALADLPVAGVAGAALESADWLLSLSRDQCRPPGDGLVDHAEPARQQGRSGDQPRRLEHLPHLGRRSRHG